jgi:hypothetical protein
MNLFVAVVCCKRDKRNGCLDWFRPQVMGQKSIPYRIFFGDGYTAMEEDEVVVQADDAYPYLPWKVQAMLKWVLHNSSCSHILKVDCDSALWLNNISPGDYEPWDYVGNFADGKNPPLRPSTYAIGGGYVLSRRAAEMVIASVVQNIIEPFHYPPFEKAYAEDAFVGRVLHKMNRLHSEKFQANMAGHYYLNSIKDLIVLGNAWSTERGRR